MFLFPQERSHLFENFWRTCHLHVQRYSACLDYFCVWTDYIVVLCICSDMESKIPEIIMYHIIVPSFYLQVSVTC